MFTKIKWFVKGFYACSNLMMVGLVWALSEKTTRLEKEIENSNNPSYYRKKYCSKCPKGGHIPPAKPKYPVGFAPSNTDIDSDE